MAEVRGFSLRDWDLQSDVIRADVSCGDKGRLTLNREALGVNRHYHYHYHFHHPYLPSARFIVFS